MAKLFYVLMTLIILFMPFYLKYHAWKKHDTWRLLGQFVMKNVKNSREILSLISLNCPEMPCINDINDEISLWHLSKAVQEQFC